MQPGDPVRYRGRLFVLVTFGPDGYAIIRDDEDETMRVRTALLSPA